MIVEVLGWLAVADAVAAVVLAGVVYVIGRRSGKAVSVRQAVALAILLGVPAAALYLGAWLLWRSA